MENQIDNEMETGGILWCNIEGLYPHMQGTSCLLILDFLGCRNLFGDPLTAVSYKPAGL